MKALSRICLNLSLLALLLLYLSLLDLPLRYCYRRAAGAAAAVADEGSARELKPYLRPHVPALRVRRRCPPRNRSACDRLGTGAFMKL